MSASALIRTGVPWLDELLVGLREGDNVLWCAETGTHVEEFVRAFLQASTEDGRKTAYVSFNHSPIAMNEKIGDLLHNPDLVLVDCFTNGKGQGDPIFTRFYDDAPGDHSLNVIRVTEPGVPESFDAAINEITRKHGPQASYVFDSLNGIQDLSGDVAEVSRFCARACPKVSHMSTVAYWLCSKRMSASPCCSRVQHVIQVIVQLTRAQEGYSLRLAKAEDRALGPEAEAPQRYRISGELPQLVADGKRELLRLGRLIRAARKKRGLSQAALGELLGVTASTISQAEAGLIALSLSNVFRLARELELTFASLIDEGESAPDSVSILRENDRSRIRLAGSKRKPIIGQRLLGTELKGNLEPMIVIIPPGVSLDRHFAPHKGAEFGLLLDGSLEVAVAHTTRQIHAGDSIYLEKDTPTAWCNPDTSEARLLWMALK